MYNSVICDAIQRRLVLQLTYELKIRLVEPHAYGTDDEDHELLRAWQQSPLPSDWRTFRLDKATGIAITATRFLQPRPGYKLNDAAMKKRMFCQLDLK
jgi:predicted DNA-binding transcriptional regulator YafY